MVAKIRLLIITLIWAGAMMPNNAAAEPTLGPAVLNPLPNQRLTIEVIGEGFGVRTFAREVDAQLEGLLIYPRGSCAKRKKTTCIRVVSDHYGDSGWYATTLSSLWNERTIYVNLDAPHHDPYALMAHEFGHILGMDHHLGEGVCGATPDVRHLSESELAVLNAAYPVDSLWRYTEPGLLRPAREIQSVEWIAAHDTRHARVTRTRVTRYRVA